MNNPTLDTGPYWRMNGRGIRGGTFKQLPSQAWEQINGGKLSNTHRDGINRTWEVPFIGFRIVRNGQ